MISVAIINRIGITSSELEYYRYMEYLTFNQHGQWSLEKTARNDRPADADFLSYRNKQGTLPQDFNTKGRAKMGSHSPKHQSKNVMEGKVPTPVASQYADNHPGLASTN